MKKLFDWIMTLLFLPFFVGTLVIFHPILLIALYLGSRPFRVVLDTMNHVILITLRIAGVRITVERSDTLPDKGPIILVSNHQSMFDIPLIICALSRYSPLFVAKKELMKGLPSISLALREMGSICIDRKDPKSAIPLIEGFGRKIEQEKSCACIFPEGTRARDGKVKQFKSSGFYALLRTAPSATIIPVTINGSWKIVSHGLFPVPFGTKLTLKVGAPLIREGKNEEELFSEVQESITREILG